MKKVILKPTLNQDKGVWIVPFLIPSWCSSCPPDRDFILIKSESKPTIKQIRKELKKLDYEIED